MKKPPQFIEGERAILGGMLIDNSTIPQVVEVLGVDDFAVEPHRLIYAAVIELFEANQPVDWLTLPEALKREGALEHAGGNAYLVRLADAVPSAANIMHYAGLVRDKALRRRAIQAAGAIGTNAHDEEQDVGEFLDDAEQLIFRISEGRFNGGAVTARALMKAGLETVDALYHRREALTGVPSGFRDLDTLTAGFQAGDLVVIAGRPSMGKTAFALDVAVRAAIDHGVPTGVFSLEMSKEQIGLRMLCARAHVDLAGLRRGYVSHGDWGRIALAAGNLAEARIYVDDTPGMTSLEVRAKARRLKQQHQIGLLIIDYLQLMEVKGGGESREREISKISRSLKALAKELSIPVIALSQLNRKVEERSDKRPMLSDLRESGAIEQDADVIIFIYRDEVYHKEPENPRRGEAEIIVGKQRNGPIGTVKLAFRSAWSTFLPLARDGM
ncbi:MAG: replicative DNA helicase [Thermodesulfobacteriota bacterium]